MAVEAQEVVTHLLVVLAAVEQVEEHILLLMAMEVMALEILVVAVEAMVVVPTTYLVVVQVQAVQVK